MFVIYALRGLAVSLEEVEVVTYGITNPHASVHIPCITRHRYGKVVLAEYGWRGEIAQRRTVTHTCQHSARLCLALDGTVQFGIFGTYINEECAIEVIRLKMLLHQREGQRVESLPKLRRDDGGMVGETGEDGSLVQTYPTPTYDENPFTLYVNVYW